MKRIFSIIILSAILLVTACGAAPVELLDFIGADTEGLNFDGAKITLSSFHVMPAENSEVGAFSKIFFDLNTIFGDAILGRIDEIESGLNVSLSFDNQD